MAAIVLEIIGFAAAVLAAVAAVYMLCIRAVSSGVSGRLVVVLPCGDDNDCVRLLYSAHLRVHLFAGCCKGGVVAVDTGMTDSQRRLCEELCESCGNIKIITPYELSTYFQKDEV